MLDLNILNRQELETLLRVMGPSRSPIVASCRGNMSRYFGGHSREIRSLVINGVRVYYGG